MIEDERERDQSGSHEEEAYDVYNLSKTADLYIFIYKKSEPYASKLLVKQ